MQQWYSPFVYPAVHNRLRHLIDSIVEAQGTEELAKKKEREELEEAERREREAQEAAERRVREERERERVEEGSGYDEETEGASGRAVSSKATAETTEMMRGQMRDKLRPKLHSHCCEGCPDVATFCWKLAKSLELPAKSFLDDKERPTKKTVQAGSNAFNLGIISTRSAVLKEMCT